MWRSTATTFVAYLAPGSTDRLYARAELDDRMRLNNGSFASSYDTARIFAGLGFAFTASRSPGGSSGKEVTVTEHTPHIDFDNLPMPSEGFLVTLFITVRSVARSRAFYSEVLGGQVVLKENPCMVKLSNSCVIMNPRGPDTPDT